MSAYSPKSIDSWNIEHILNCSGEFCTKKYTILSEALDVIICDTWG